MPPTNSSANSVVVMSRTPATSPVGNQRLHGLSAIARGVKDQHLVAGRLKDFAGALHARRRHTEHRGGHERPVVCRDFCQGMFHHARHRGRGCRENAAADTIEARDVDYGIEHQDVFIGDVGTNLSRRQRADHQLGNAQR